ncbi:MAG TPA: helix-hairpin-helix domain-containing protein [Bryobacteraceae bacterium]|nr:helix-hairpin-helix domain-containing protein [Bryobacteraceae bacterium]
MNIYRSALILLPILFSLSAQPQDLPEAKGKDLYEKICGACHGTDVVFKTRTTKEKWKNTVDEMASRGAEGTDEQLDTITDYLAKCFGPRVNVNKAAAKEIETQFELTSTEAEAIVKYRQEKGDFKDVAGLKNVTGLDFSKIESVRYRIIFADGAE